MRTTSVLALAALLAAAPAAFTQEGAPAAPATTAAAGVAIADLAAQGVTSAEAALADVVEVLESKGDSLGTTEHTRLLERRELAGTQLDQARGLAEQVTSLPSPGDAVAFLKVREELEQLLERRRRERDLQAEKAQLAVQSGDAHDARLARQTARFLVEQIETLEAAIRALAAAWDAAHADDKAREDAEAVAREQIAAESASEEEAVRTRVLEETRERESARKEAEELADRAREELQAARTEEEAALAELRLDFATLKAEAEKLRVTALQAEVRAREAERQHEDTRADLARRIPTLLAPGTDRGEIARVRDELLAEGARLEKEAEILRREVHANREEVPALRARVQELASRYDELEAELEEKRGDSTFRRMVYFARLAHRHAAEKLDQYRTWVEWKERRRLVLGRHAGALREAAGRLEGKAAARFLGQTFDQWVRFLLSLLGAVLASMLVDFLFRGIFKSVAGRTRWSWDDIAIAELRSPVRILVLLGGSYVALRSFQFPPGGEAIVARALDALATCWVGFLAWRLLNTMSRALEPRIERSESKLDDQLLRFLRRGLRVVILGVTGIFVLEAFGWQVTSVLAGLGIGGLAFALAAKDTLANLFGSIMLFADRPFQVGNWVIVDGVEGVVEDIGIRSTRIRTFKDTIVTIPNANVANAAAENIHSFRKRRLYFTLTLRLDTSGGKVKKVVDEIRDILTDHPMVLDGHYVYMTGILDSGLQVMIYCFVGTRDWREWMHHSQDIYLQVLEMLEENGVSLAFPTHTVEVEGGSPFDRMPGESA